MTPADELRTAAEKLRTLAVAASTESGRPTAHWAVRYQPGAIPGAAPHTDRSCYLDAIDEAKIDGRGAHPLLRGGSGGTRPRPAAVAPQHGRYIATMDPSLGLALADWLDSWTGVDLTEHGPMPEDARHALAVARQILGTTTEQPETGLDELEPIQLRWGLDDVMYGDDDTTTVLLSGPGREPYWVELDPERTAALREVLAGPAAQPARVDRAAVLREAASLLVDHAATLEALSTSDYDNEAFAASHLRTKAVDLHRLADRAAAGMQRPTTTGDTRTRIADALAKADGWEWAPGYDMARRPSYQEYLRQADVALTALATPPAAPAAPEEPTR